MNRAGLAFTLTVLALAGLPRAASADEFFRHGDLVCHARAAIALARFTTSYNDDRPVYRRLPATVDDGLSADPGSDRTDCRLPDGRTIRLRVGHEQAFAYGAGGGDPPSFFSLWIDRRKVLSKRVWREGYEKTFERPPVLVGLAIRPERLTFCYATEGSPQVSCHDEKLTLSAGAIDRAEYGGPKPTSGTVLLGRGSRDRALCRRYLDTLGSSFDGLLLGQDDHTKFAPAIAWNAGTWFGHANVTSAQVIAAPGAPPLRLMAFSGTTHFFDGDIYVVTPLTVSSTEVKAFWESDDDPESIPTRPRPDGWAVVSGGVSDLYPQVSPRYVHLRTQRVDGRLYLLAYPTNRKQRPTAILLLITQQAKAVPVCEFQRVEPSF